METEPASHLIPEGNEPERKFEVQNEANEQAKEEVAKLFEGKLNPGVIMRLFDSGYGWTHERFALLIEMGQATKEDERAYIEARNGWKEDSALRDKWDAELVKISLEDHGRRA